MTNKHQDALSRAVAAHFNARQAIADEAARIAAERAEQERKMAVHNASNQASPEDKR